MDALTIGDVARRTGLRTSAIRYYGSLGLIPEPRRVSGQRRYNADVLSHLAVVRMAQEAGFTVEEVHTLVTGLPEGTAAGDRWREVAYRALSAVDAMIDRLRAMRWMLEQSVACGRLTLDACAVLGWAPR